MRIPPDLQEILATVHRNQQQIDLLTSNNTQLVKYMLQTGMIQSLRELPGIGAMPQLLQLPGFDAPMPKRRGRPPINREQVLDMGDTNGFSMVPSAVLRKKPGRVPTKLLAAAAAAEPLPAPHRKKKRRLSALQLAAMRKNAVKARRAQALKHKGVHPASPKTTHRWTAASRKKLSESMKASARKRGLNVKSDLKKAATA